MRPSTRVPAALAVASVALLVAFVGTHALPVFPAGARGSHELATNGERHVRASSIRPVRISGNMRGTLMPGRTVPLNLSLRNPNPIPLAITRLTVRVTGVSAPNADADHPCSAADFKGRRLTGKPAPRLGPHQARHLRRMHVRRTRMPAVQMLNLQVNQDGCKGARLTLSYAARVRPVRR